MPLETRMGVEVDRTTFKSNDHREFQNKLSQEILFLHHLIKNTKPKDQKPSFGVEVEGWLIDNNAQASPTNDKFLAQLNNPSVVSELLKYNIELNGAPYPASGNVFELLYKDIINLWGQCKSQAQKMNLSVVTIGSLPTLNLKDFGISAMSKGNRYMALNHEILRFNNSPTLPIHISGLDELKFESESVMIAGAATSFQFHYKVPLATSHQYYNASLLASAPMAALSANSPFIFGKKLWHESRIPIFEQAVAGWPGSPGNIKRRASFGPSLLEQSISEYFIKIVQKHPTLLPVVKDTPAGDFEHLRLHSGTVWSWNRPVIGKDQNGQLHIRIEHRVPSAGPTFVDSFANMAFFIGLVHELVESHNPFQTQHSFTTLKKNFYAAAKEGLYSSINLSPKSKQSIKSVILETYIKLAHKGLLKLGINKDVVDFYLFEVIKQRVETEQNGAIWQLKFIEKYGADFKNLTLQYMENQENETPIHKWAV